MVEAGGIEPRCDPCKHCPIQGVGHKMGPDVSENPELLRLGESWANLPENIRNAILALAGIDPSEAGRK